MGSRSCRVSKYSPESITTERGYPSIHQTRVMTSVEEMSPIHIIRRNARRSLGRDNCDQELQDGIPRRCTDLS